MLTPEIVAATRPSELSFHASPSACSTRTIARRGPTRRCTCSATCSASRDGGSRRAILTAKGVPIGAIRYPELEARAADLIFFACQRGVQGEKTIKAILDSYNPKGSTRFVAFNTSKSTWTTAPHKSHVSHVVCDSEWEAELARVLEAHPKVIAYVKNQAMQFDVPYRDGSVPRKYIPDFIVKIDDGGPELLNLVLEVKGFRGVDAQLKAETMKTLWVPGVNNLGAHGRWAFEEFRDIYGAEEQFAKVASGLTQPAAVA